MGKKLLCNLIETVGMLFYMHVRRIMTNVLRLTVILTHYYLAFNLIHSHKFCGLLFRELAIYFFICLIENEKRRWRYQFNSIIMFSFY